MHRILCARALPAPWASTVYCSLMGRPTCVSCRLIHRLKSRRSSSGRSIACAPAPARSSSNGCNRLCRLRASICVAKGASANGIGCSLIPIPASAVIGARLRQAEGANLWLSSDLRCGSSPHRSCKLTNRFRVAFYDRFAAACSICRLPKVRTPLEAVWRNRLQARRLSLTARLCGRGLGA